MVRIESSSLGDLVLRLSAAAALVAPLAAQQVRSVKTLAPRVDVVDDIARLRSRPVPSGPSKVRCYVVLGHHDPGDGGYGIFHWDAAESGPDDNGTTIVPQAHAGPGRWMRLLDGMQVSVRWFGAKGDGATDDSQAIQDAIDYVEAGDGSGVVFFPAGRYRVETTLDIPVSGRGITLRGTAQSDGVGGAGNFLLSYVAAGQPLFRTTGTGSAAFFKVESLSFGQVSTAGHFFQFDHLVSMLRMEGIYFSLGNTAASFLRMNDVEHSFVRIENLQGVMARGATVPAFDFQTPVGSGNLSNIQCVNHVVNSDPTATAPVYLVRNKNEQGSPALLFRNIVLEQPGGGGMHLYSVRSPILQGITTADAAQTNGPVILFDNELPNIILADPILIGCVLTTGTTAQPDVRCKNSTSTAWPHSPVIIGSRINILDVGYAEAVIIGSNISSFTGSTESLRLYAGDVMGVKGLTRSQTVATRPRNLNGTEVFKPFDGGSVFVGFDVDEIDPFYKIILTGDANETFRVSSKSEMGFQLESSNSFSTATVDWLLMR